jgi:hypothetical protein
MAVTFQHKRGTAARWVSINPVLLAGEPGYEIDTGKFKIGDGLRAWVDLPYSSGPKGDKGDKGDMGADSTVPGPAGVDGCTPIKGVDYFDGNDGYTPVKGVDYFDGNDGYTPVKNIDYFDGAASIIPGPAGYTPVKGVDYFDGEKGDRGDKGDPSTVPGPSGYTPIKGVDYFDGTQGIPGYTPIKNIDYFDGVDGYTPVKGVDYFDGSVGPIGPASTVPGPQGPTGAASTIPGPAGYTPIKGVDYFDGEDGYTPIKGVDYFDGAASVVPGPQGPAGADSTVPGPAGYTPVKGVDYFDGVKGDQGDQGIQGPAGSGTGYAINVQALTSSPTDSQTVYFGMLPKAPTTTANISKIYIPKSGTIKHAEIYCYSGTAGTAESWSLYVRLNNTTDTLIRTLAVSANERRFYNDALNIAVVAGNYIEIKGIQPLWATNPATCIYGGFIYIE